MFKILSENPFILCQILFKQGKARESILLFKQAIALTAFSKSFPNRAQAYITLGSYDSAIMDYKKMAYYNFDYYRPLAEVYKTMKLKDSALKYYRLFLEHYPESNIVKLEMSKLEKEK